ncbi:MAG: hypothetical protein KDC95_06630 [Planctomycetes bacterium]|nr:hypothetical protein [Planctomycetota bacterium]
MNINTRIAVLVACFAATSSLSAQSFTSPSGLASTDGSGAFVHVLGAAPKLRMQQIDSSNKSTTARTLTSLAFRRDAALATSTDFGARVLENLSITMSHAQLSTISRDFDANYKDKPVIVFAPKNVNTPDWSSKPATAVAPFDFKLTFDTPWIYNGTDDLLFEVSIEKVTSAPTVLTSMPCDLQKQTGSFATSLRGATFGTGCIAGGQTTRFVLATQMHNTSARFVVQASANFGPKKSAALLMLDFVDQNISAPGVCAVVHALPTLILPLGTTSDNGAIAATRESGLPYVPSAIGASLYFQAWAIDATQSGIGIAFSQGQRQTIPSTPTLPATGRVYAYDVAGCVLPQGPYAGGVVTQFEYR